MISKKEGNVRFITEYRSLNQKLLRSPYKLHRIGKNIQKLEGFQYEAALDLSMGYCTIRFTPACLDMTMIVTEFGKFRYNRLPTDMYAPGDILQSKVDELLGDIKGVETYIGDILVLIKD